MARAHFTDDFDYAVVGRSVTISYKAGRDYTVKRDCLDKAIAAGKATELPAPSRPEAGHGG
ncbi:hypothetical protein [Asticcacaulis sp.]|uniref:hypothetical protein n=1 Tax=Asticcacaulis sp. TaxID=1872648 RepID=UPI003F7BAE7E